MMQPAEDYRHDYDQDLFSKLIEALPESILGVPGAGTVDFDAHRLTREPHVAFSELRDRLGGLGEIVDGAIGGMAVTNPHGWGEGFRKFVVLGYDAGCEYAAKPASELSIENSKLAMQEIYGRVLGMIEGPDHLRVRRAMDKNALGRGQIEQRAEALMRPAAEYLVDRLAFKISRGEVGEARRDLVLPMVYKPMSGIIGVPEHRFDYFMPICHEAFQFNTDQDGARRAAGAIGDFLQVELEERKICPAEDILSRLLHNDDAKLQMTDDEIVRNCAFLLPAGLDTTRYTMVTMLAALMMHPEQYREVAEDPSLVPAAVEECLRWLPASVLGGVRVAVSDTVLCGMEIPEGSRLTICSPSMNRDPKYWKDPERFDIHRTETTPHMTFLMGRHYCIGQNLARKEMNILLETLVTRLPGLRSVIPPGEIKIQGGLACGPGQLLLTA